MVALEVMSAEDSRAMDVSLCSSSTAGVQSTSRSWKRRLLLAVAPVLGVALVTAAYMSQADAGHRVGKSAHDGELAGGGPEAMSFRDILARDATPFALEKEYPPLTEPVHNPKDIKFMCPEDNLPPERDDEGPNTFPRATSSLGLLLKRDRKYRVSYHLEPTDPKNGGKSCRAWSDPNWKFYAEKNNVSEPVVVKVALRVMQLAPDHFSQFRDKYLEAQPKAVVVEVGEEVMIIDEDVGEDEAGVVVEATAVPVDVESDPQWLYMGLSRPASRAWSLFDLKWGMYDHLSLAVMMHSALSQLPVFYQRTGYRFHGLISSHYIEVLMDGGPLVAYVTGYEDAVAWHVQKEAGEEPGFASLAPLEVYSSEKGQLTSRVDTWSVGLALAEKLALMQQPSFQAEEKAWELTTPSLQACDDGCDPSVISTAEKKKKFEKFVRVALSFCGLVADDTFCGVLKHMIAVDVKERWNVGEALDELKKLITHLGQSKAR